MSTNSKCDPHTLKKLWTIISLVWQAEKKTFLILTCVGILAAQALGALSLGVSADLYGIMSKTAATLPFAKATGYLPWVLAVILGCILCQSLVPFVKTQLALWLRSNTTHELLCKYFKNDAHKELHQEEIDSPALRIISDLALTINNTVDLSFNCLDAAVRSIALLVVLGSINAPLAAAATGLILCALLIGHRLAEFLKPRAQMLVMAEQAFSTTLIQSNGPGSTSTETHEAQANRCLGKAINAGTKVCNATGCINATLSSFDQLAWWAPLGILWLCGGVTIGSIAACGIAFQQLWNTFSSLLKGGLPAWTNLKVSANRVYVLYRRLEVEVLEEAHSTPRPPSNVVYPTAFQNNPSSRLSA